MAEPKTTKSTIDVYSTLSTDMLYTGYRKGGGDIAIIAHQIFIKGGANVAGKFGQTDIVKKTSISAQDYDILLNNPIFKGHITIRKDATKDLEAKDKSAPATPKDTPTNLPLLDIKN
jgi:hypothetical protein